jgi:Zn-dependent protease with chaperone function
VGLFGVGVRRFVLFLVLVLFVWLSVVGVAGVYGPRVYLTLVGAYQVGAIVEGSVPSPINRSALIAMLAPLNSTCKYHVASAGSLVKVEVTANWSRGWLAQCPITPLVHLLGVPRFAGFSSIFDFMTNAGVYVGVGVVEVGGGYYLVFRFLGINWAWLVLSMLVLATPILTQVLIYRHLVSRQRGRRDVTYLYSMGLSGQYIPGIIAFVASFVGVFMSMVPMQFLLEPISFNNQTANVLLSIYLPIAVVGIAFELTRRHYVRILREPVRDRLERVIDVKAARRLAIAVLVLVFGFGGVMGYVYYLLFMHFKLGSAPILVVALVNLALSAALFGVLLVVPQWFITRGVVEDPGLSRVVGDIWVRMGGVGRAPRVYLVDSVGGSRYNAVAVGLFRRRIIVAKQLLGLLSEEEFRSVLIHEVSHVKHGHLAKLLMVVMPLYLALITIALTSFIKYMLLPGIAAFGSLFALTPLVRFIQRRLETQADIDAVKVGFNPRAYIAAMGKITRESLMPLTFTRLDRPLLTHPEPIRRALRVAREFNIPIDEALKLLKGEANP